MTSSLTKTSTLAPPLPMFTPHVLPSFILTTILISFHIPPSISQQYEPNCTIPYTCGQNLQPIGYPFSGRDRHPSCGLPGFELNCRSSDYTTTITINSQIYRLLQIDTNDRTITLSRDNVCPESSSVERDLNDTLFGYSNDDVQFLDLYRSCPSFSIPDKDTIRCGSAGSVSYLNESFGVADTRLCRPSAAVPVNRTLGRDFEGSDGISLEELIGSGVRVEYKYDVGACLKCQESDGDCWSGTNSSQSSCICTDGIRYGDCSGKAHSNILLKLGIGIGAGLFGLLTSCVVLYKLRRKSKSSASTAFRKWKPTCDDKVEVFILQYGASIPQRYRYSDVKKMTNSFNDELGEGGYGKVFKGKLDDDRLVAVKVLNESKGSGEEFINEVSSIGKTSHVNIVSLFGFCYEGKQRALVYEFMPNGSLEKFINHKLSEESAQHLRVEKRHEIAVGIARGLEYLHHGCATRILHFDIKPHNILLDKDFCPKISDFGLAKIHSRNESIVSMKEEARGTIGYIAPEVFNRNFGGVSHKSDVYSYGMMVLEMVCGKKNINARVNHSSEIYFPQWIYKQLELDEDLQLQEERIPCIVENEIARKMIIVGLWCIQTNPSQRPSIKKVIEMLEGTIEAMQIPPNTFYSSPPRPQVTSSITPDILSLE